MSVGLSIRFIEPLLPHGATVTGTASGTADATGTATGTAPATTTPSGSGFVGGLGDDLPRFRIRTTTRHSYRIVYRHRIRVVVTVTRQHRTATRSLRTVTVGKSHTNKARTGHHRTTEIRKSRHMAKRATPASEAWVQERNIRDLAELAFALAARR